ncbi:hypothetical protein CCP4SC76_210004 [Gammaproteobacteria bacterium]
MNLSGVGSINCRLLVFSLTCLFLMSGLSMNAVSEESGCVPGEASFPKAPNGAFATPMASDQTSGKCTRLTLSPSSVNIVDKVGKSGSNDSLQVKNLGNAEVNFMMRWSPATQNVDLSPMSGILQSHGTNTISANYFCPDKGNWTGTVGVLRPSGNGKIEGSSEISLTCWCNDCCGHCCGDGEQPPKCGCPNANPSSPCCENPDICRPGHGWGDPHLTTFDGLIYDFQGVGEFIPVKSALPNDTFEVQVRNRPWGYQASVTTAAAMKIGGDRVGFYGGMDPPLRINGVPTTLDGSNSITLPTGGKIVRMGSTYRVSTADNSIVDVRDGGGYFYVGVGVPSTKFGHVIGFFGNADKNNQNDIATRDGVSLGSKVKFNTLYPTFADSWRISQQESLFDYAPGESTETFTDLIFPRTHAETAGLSETDRTKAEKICKAARHYRYYLAG